MKRFLTVLLATVVTGSPYQVYTQPSDQYCLADDDNPYLHFSTKTSYQVAKGRKPFQPVPNCKPEAIWLLVRHGTRNPSADFEAKIQELTSSLTAIIENHEARHNGELCAEDLEALKKWHPSYLPMNFDQLAEEGKADLKQLAGSFKLGLPELFDKPTPDKIYLKHTTAQRTKDSAQAFLEGLYKPNTPVNYTFSEYNIDEILMVSSGYSKDISKNCTEWDNSRETDAAWAEGNAYIKSEDVNNMIHHVSTRLGFKYDLDYKLVQNMYDVCRSEKAVYYHNPISPWCAAFTKEDLETLEYLMDIEYYYDSGYGNPMTAQLGCPLVRDMILKLDNITKNNGTSEALVPLTLYFAHSVTLRSAITKLGLAWDSVAPTHSNRKSMNDRQWKTSRISPFTGNLAVVLYRCTAGEEWRIMFYLNEHLVNYEGCHLGLCDWPYIFGRFKDHIDPETCNTDFCFKANDAPNNVVFWLWPLLGSISRLIF